jgi:hypothetical protein
VFFSTGSNFSFCFTLGCKELINLIDISHPHNQTYKLLKELPHAMFPDIKKITNIASQSKCCTQYWQVLLCFFFRKISPEEVEKIDFFANKIKWVEFYKAWTFRTCFFIYCLFIFYLKDYQKAQAS